MNPEYIKEQIREQVKISNLVESLTGQKFIRNKMLCPLHKEKTPSFFVNDNKGLFYCQGCHEGGDIFKFVQLYNGISFKDAVSFIDNHFNLGLTNSKIKYGQFIQAKIRANNRKEEIKYESVKDERYDKIASEYRFCVRALVPGTLEPFSDLWAYYINKKTYLDYLIEEGGY